MVERQNEKTMNEAKAEVGWYAKHVPENRFIGQSNSRNWISDGEKQKEKKISEDQSNARKWRLVMKLSEL